ncbi:MAG: hypothetical protein HYT87_14430 [Nitrospirae bacterium]|nr:hypothetical protein [Nitrospirota bacterium]
MKITAKKLELDPQQALAPDSGLWGHVPASRLKLDPSPLENQPSEYVRNLPKKHGAIHEISVKIAHDGKSIYVRLEWNDSKKDAAPSDSDPFPDAAAVMFPGQEGLPSVFENDPISMGADDIPVNAWLWRADFGDKAKDVRARGFGTSKRLPDSTIAARGEWKNGRWQVVLSRTLAAPDAEKEVAALPAQGTVPIAFAVWEGSNKERAGLKSTVPGWLLLEVKA